MVRHLVLWKYGDGFSDIENKDNASKIKEILEQLKGKIPGIISINVIIEPLLIGSCDADIILNSLFESEEALSNYQVHPEHVKAGSFIRTVVKDRKCVDYNEV